MLILDHACVSLANHGEKLVLLVLTDGFNLAQNGAHVGPGELIIGTV